MSVTFAKDTTGPTREAAPQEDTFTSPQAASSDAVAQPNALHLYAGDQPPPSDPERQPLIATRELNRRRTWLPIVVCILLLGVFGVVLGFGGWRLGSGEGSGRWPGGPQ